MEYTDTYLILILLGIVILSFSTLGTNRNAPQVSSSLPSVPYRLPFIGSAFEFVLDQRKFFRSYRARFGRQFRALIGGRSIIALASPRAMDAVYRNREKKLEAQRAFRRSALGDIQYPDFGRMLTDVLFPLVVNANIHSDFHATGPSLNAQFERCFTDQHALGSPLALRRFVMHTLFHSFTFAYFGPSFPTAEVFEDFVTVDAQSYFLFNPLLSPFAFSAHAAQRRIHARLSAYIAQWDAAPGTEDLPGISTHGNAIGRALVRSAMPRKDQAGTLQLYIWGAIFVNTSNVLFWALAHLLADPAALARVRSEVGAAVAEGFFGAEADARYAADPAALATERFALLDSALKEAARLHVLPVSYRDVREDMELPDASGTGTFTVRKGDVVVPNTIAVHHDAQWFADPDVFRLDRFVGEGGVEANRHLYTWGRGAHMCAGRQMANYLMKMFFIMMLRTYDVVPADGSPVVKVPAGEPRSVSTMTPVTDLNIRLVKRNE
ncbi:cytochrome P450 [Epithele typhae]|uniref:cytochrome P450 n=1 Tax=Epithele typhae TaxID=378194 RepID=UPI0020086E2F|nr:cytochrome P450 [Epithele typhae]KAH9912150.1 cytochrome P450 [Epithele typhae]